MPEVGLLGQEGGEPGAVEAAGPGHDRGHDLVAHHLVGHGVDGHLADVGVAGQDALDRRGGEVLAVDPQPLEAPAGEVDEAVGVEVGEVAGPVDAVPDPLPVGLVVGVVALEAGGAAWC